MFSEVGNELTIPRVLYQLAGDADEGKWCWVVVMMLGLVVQVLW
jgi:hypothetical protein